ncbi:MAG: tRNA (guanosine(18)-2'-O)-methyltransferase, partial [uncultured Thermomicrobiales bacterium]
GRHANRGGPAGACQGAGWEDGPLAADRAAPAAGRGRATPPPAGFDGGAGECSRPAQRERGAPLVRCRRGADGARRLLDRGAAAVVRPDHIRQRREVGRHATPRLDRGLLCGPPGGRFFDSRRRTRRGEPGPVRDRSPWPDRDRLRERDARRLPGGAGGGRREGRGPDAGDDREPQHLRRLRRGPLRGAAAAPRRRRLRAAEAERGDAGAARGRLASAL